MTRKMSRLLASTALATVGAIWVATPAAAQSSAQRMQELQRMIEAQQAQIAAQAKMLDQLQREMKDLSAQTQADAAAASQAAAQARAAAAQAGEKQEIPPKVARSGKKGVKLTVSGQVNRAMLLADDGNKTHLTHVDNDASSTRVRFAGEGKFSDEFKVGARVEVQFESNSSASVNQFMERGVGPNSFTERKLEIYFDSKTFGRLWLGQGDTASNGISEQDLSGTDMVLYSGVADLAGGYFFQATDLPAAQAGVPSRADPTIGGSFNQLDGLSRDDRIRYDTPKWNGLQLSTSHAAGGRWDVAARFAGKFLDTKIAAALGYYERAGRQGVSGSVSALHSTGVSVTFAAGELNRQGGRADQNFWYAKLGYQRKFFEIGKTFLGIDYYDGEDIGSSGEDSSAWAVGLVQSIDKISTELYLGGRVYDVDVPGRTFEDFVAVMAGARIKF